MKSDTPLTSELRTDTIVDGRRLTTDCKPHSRFYPRYLAYCAVNGKTPDEMLRYDDKRWPGGRMAGYILWIGERWQEWRAEKGYGPRYILSDTDHAEFDTWLNTKATFQEAA